jgi:ApaG protein
MANPRFTCTVEARYLPEQSDAGRQSFAFAYSVTIRNTGDVAAQLVGRHWHIVDATGATQEVRGLGVVGHQPLLQPGEEFNYTSWTRIGAPNGRMQGTYFCMTEDAHPFDAPIQPFELSMAQALH